MRTTKKHDGMASPLKPVMMSEFAAALQKNVVDTVLEPGFVSLDELNENFKLSASYLHYLLRHSNKIERKKFKLPGMKTAQYFYRVKK